ncbi:hypothetical protein SASPL_103869 [Salvia splendens]|uniref:VASt domain-containing protein n=1 Tax=Salvia splendens TaxID=180675 RepID=A0A8X8YIV7_SALSN|nr:hypothetical protein SASPL_103869 [Salvia splendens]
MMSEKMVDPAPSITRNSSQQFSGESPSGSPSPEAPDRSSSSTPSPSRQLYLQGQPPTRVEEYRQLFRLPPDEVLIQDFNCALQENFLLQKIIPFTEITSIRRANAVAVFPTAIEIIAGGKKYFFTSLLFRDEAYKLINEGWVHHGGRSKEITDQQEPKLDASSQENGSYIIEKSISTRQSLDVSDIIGSDNNHLILEESKHLADGEPEIIPTSSVIEVKEEPNALPAPVTECSSSEKSFTWEPEPTDAPGVPEGYTRVAESKFPVRAEEFFNIFFSDDSVNFHESFHAKCGDKDFKCSSWQPHEKFGHTRDVQDLVAVKRFRNIGFIGTGKFHYYILQYYFVVHDVKHEVFLDCQQQNRTWLVYPEACLAFQLSLTRKMCNLANGECSDDKGRWDVEQVGNDSTPSCTLRVYTNVAFSKKTMWKGKIVQSTVEECREAYAIWIDLAHEVLKQKKLEKGGVSASNMNTNIVQPEKQANSLQHLEAKSSDPGIPTTLPDVTDMNQQVTYIPQGNASPALTGSLFTDTLAKFYSSMKHMSTPSLLLVVAIAVILVLMQLSILVLLSRPQRIHVIPQAGCANGLGNRGDAVGRQIKYLKEEMHFVETLLEKMQDEHAQLKEKLRELELFRN